MVENDIDTYVPLYRDILEITPEMVGMIVSEDMRARGWFVVTNKDGHCPFRIDSDGGSSLTLNCLASAVKLLLEGSDADTVQPPT